MFRCVSALHEARIFGSLVSKRTSLADFKRWVGGAWCPCRARASLWLMGTTTVVALVTMAANTVWQNVVTLRDLGCFVRSSHFSQFCTASGSFFHSTRLMKSLREMYQFCIDACWPKPPRSSYLRGRACVAYYGKTPRSTIATL